MEGVVDVNILVECCVVFVKSPSSSGLMTFWTAFFSCQIVCFGKMCACFVVGMVTELETLWNFRPSRLFFSI